MGNQTIRKQHRTLQPTKIPRHKRINHHHQPKKRSRQKSHKRNKNLHRTRPPKTRLTSNRRTLARTQRKRTQPRKQHRDKIHKILHRLQSKHQLHRRTATEIPDQNMAQPNIRNTQRPQGNSEGHVKRRTLGKRRI